MTAETIHTCSYYCERPECIKRQRDELRDRMESVLASAPPSAPEPEVHSYDPTEQRQSVTIRWPDGKCLGYVLDRTRYTDNLPPSAPVGVDDELRVQAALLRTPEFMAQFDPDKFARQLERIAAALAGSVPQRYDIDADPNGIRADVTRCVRAALYCGANNVNPPPEGHWLRDFWLIGRAEASRQDDLAAQQPAAPSGEAVVERIAALLHEEATDEPWTVAGVEHLGPDRDYYRGLARKVAALAQQQGGRADG